MIKFVCDLCGKEVDGCEQTLTQRTLIKSVAPEEYYQVDFCDYCLKRLEEEQETALVSVHTKFLKEMKKI